MGRHAGTVGGRLRRRGLPRRRRDQQCLAARLIGHHCGMYLPSHFEETRPERMQELMRAHPLGLLVTQDGAGALVANTIPFLFDAGAGGSASWLRGHVARANPVWCEARTDVDALVV